VFADVEEEEEFYEMAPDYFDKNTMRLLEVARVSEIRI
jgi:hypothetical protein